MTTQVSTASKGYKQIHFNVGIYIAGMSFAYSQITCFSCRTPMVTQVSTASPGYKQIYFNMCIYITALIIRSDHKFKFIQLSRSLREAFASLREAFARLTGGQGTPKRIAWKHAHTN